MTAEAPLPAYARTAAEAVEYQALIRANVAQWAPLSAEEQVTLRRLLVVSPEAWERHTTRRPKAA